MGVSRKEAWPVSRRVLLLMMMLRARGKCTVLASQANDDWTNRWRARTAGRCWIHSTMQCETESGKRVVEASVSELARRPACVQGHTGALTSARRRRRFGTSGLADRRRLDFYRTLVLRRSRDNTLACRILLMGTCSTRV